MPNIILKKALDINFYANNLQNVAKIILFYFFVYCTITSSFIDAGYDKQKQLHNNSPVYRMNSAVL